MKSSSSLTTNESIDTTNESIELSDSILKAQAEADAIADAKENDDDDDSNDIDEQKELVIPKLLSVGSDGTLTKPVLDLSAKTRQLDVLLLKAESYSHFILQNQRNLVTLPTTTSDNKENDKDISTPSTIKRKSSSNTKSNSSNKKSKANVTDTPSNDSADTLMFQPSNLVGGTLMPYQREGLRWLLSLWENGLSGILADEMGLGKTIQVISLIAHLRTLNTPGPFLILGPLATLPNWINEFKKWLPSCPVILYHGSKAERQELRRKSMQISKQKDMEFPVVISSFEIALIDRTFLEKYVWQYIILDEGHRIKNRNCKLVKELKNLQSVSRLLLTGTPIQNTLEELWSLLNFCSPHIFDNLEVFQSWFGFRNIGKETQVDDIIDNEYKERVVTKLHEILRPFLLRRLKKDVLLSMPEKKEIVVYCSLSSIQSEYYALAQQNKLRDSLVEMGVERAKDVSQMNALMNLRKICLHPFLFGEPTDEQGEYIGVSNPKALIYASGKFRLLDRMLPRLYEEGRKVLIFSQMTELLTILEDYLLSKDFSYCRLDGSSKIQDRQESIDKFNKVPGNGRDKKGGVFVFLLSTRAGGLGINLATADTCILFDSDWNPHADSQAQDRCHRIGQKNNVVIYRLLCPGTCEIEMMEKQVSKKKLERMTIHGGDFGKAGQRSGSSLTIKRLRQLLADDVNLGKRLEGKSVASIATKKGGISDGEISDEELNLIMNRDKIFSDKNDFPQEGTMFDVVKAEDGGILMAIN